MGLVHLKTPDNRLRPVFIVDKREGGVVVVLECEEAEDGGGVTIPSETEEDFDYIFAEEDGRRAAERLRSSDVAPPEPLLIDTSEVPDSPIVFGLDSFIRQVQEASSPVYMDEQTAKDWGWKRRAMPGGPPAYA